MNLALFAYGGLVGVMFSMGMGVAEGLFGRRAILVGIGAVVAVGVAASFAVGVETAAATSFSPPLYHVGLVVGVVVSHPIGERMRRDLEVNGTPYVVAKAGRGGEP